METFLIIASGAVAVLALAVASAMSARARRPPLRTRREQDIADRFAGGDEEALVRSLRPAPASPIDRDAPILDVRSIEAALGERRTVDHEPGDPQGDASRAEEPASGGDRAAGARKAAR